MMPWLQNPNAQQKPGLGGQLAGKAAGKLVTDQIAKQGLVAAGTAAGGPLGGALAGAGAELAGPLAGQLVGNLFNKGGAVHLNAGGFGDWYGDQAFMSDPTAIRLLQATQNAGRNLVKDTRGANAGQPTENKHAGVAAQQARAQMNHVLGNYYKHFKAKQGEAPVAPAPEAPKKEAPVVEAPVVEAPLAPAYVAPNVNQGGKSSGGSGSWNIPLGSGFLGADWSTQGDYASGTDFNDGSKSEDSWNAGIKGTWKFNKGGEVPSEKGSIWDKVKSAASYAWKNDNKPGDRWAEKNTKPQYKAIGGMTSGPLGMSDALAAGKNKDISKVKIKKNKGDMSEEVEFNYHAPLAPKPSGE